MTRERIKWHEQAVMLALTVMLTLTAMLALTVMLTLTAASASAEKHALLIGIGDYPKNYKLKGPRHDVEALRGELIRNWGFQGANVTTLIDHQATREGILMGLDRLMEVTRPGDDVFVYYSGHGTSAYDQELGEQGRQIGDWTGALMPYDYDANLPARPTPRQWLDGLIVGTRDLRPRLERLDRERFVFVAFDTCFSGYTVRSLSERKVRWISPPVFSQTRGIDFGNLFESDPFESPVYGKATPKAPSYPYDRLIYLAAASEKERAEEVPARVTFDRLPHGAMTNSLIKGLRGAANTNRDDDLTYFELFEYVRDDVSEHHSQMPQLHYPGKQAAEQADLVRRPVFGQRGFRPAPSSPVVGSAAGDSATGPGDLRVRLDTSLGHLAERINALADVRLVMGDDYQVRLRRDVDGLVGLYHPSGDRIAGGFDDRRPRSLVERLRRQVQVQALIGLTYARQDFSLSLDLPLGRGFLHGDESFEITVAADQPVVFLMLNIDKAGTVSVLYPTISAELGKSRRRRDMFEVVPPYGTEYLKLFAFDEPPERLTYWMNQKIDVLDARFGKLLDFLENPGARRAQTRRKLVTVATLIRD